MLHILAFLLSQALLYIITGTTSFLVVQHLNCYKCATVINVSVNALGQLYNLPAHLSGVLLAFSRSSVGLQRERRIKNTWLERNYCLKGNNNDNNNNNKLKFATTVDP